MGALLTTVQRPHRSKTTLISNGVFCLLESKILSIGQTLLLNQINDHMSDFDWTGCLAGCEERWGPGGREVDGRRVTLWDPSVVLVQTQQEACGR
jgi:hypothetical protein